jgi:hypothetical protein
VESEGIRRDAARATLSETPPGERRIVPGRVEADWRAEDAEEEDEEVMSQAIDPMTTRDGAIGVKDEGEDGREDGGVGGSSRDKEGSDTGLGSLFPFRSVRKERPRM